MAEVVSTVAFKLSADTRSLLEEFQRAQREMGKTGASGKQLERDLSSLSGAASQLRGALAALGIGIGVREIVQMADTWKLVEGRIRLVTSSSAELEAVQQRLYATAQATRTGYEGTADLYTRIARSSEELGLSQDQLLQITESINQALVISGGSAASSEAALIQLGQAFASGELRGQELNSVLEQTPRLAQAIADGMGIPVGKLRALAKEGKLTAAEVAKALLSQGEAIRSEFGQMPETVGQSMTKVRNSIVKYIGEADNATGATGELATALGGVSEWIDENGPLVSGFVAAAIAAASLGTAIKGINAAVAAGGVARLVALLSNPAVAAVLVVGAVALAEGDRRMYQSGQDKTLRARLGAMDAAQFEQTGRTLRDERGIYQARQEEIGAYRAKAGTPGYDVTKIRAMEEEQKFLSQAIALLDRQIKAYDEVAAAKKKAAEAGTGKPAAGGGGGGESEADRAKRLKAEADALAEMGRKLEQAARQLQATRDAAARVASAFADEQASAAVQATATGVDDLELALQRYIKRADEARGADPLGFDETAHQRRLASFRAQIDAVRGLEAAQAEVAKAERVLDDMARRRSAAEADGVAFVPTDADLRKLAASRTTLRAIADDTSRSGAERKIAADALLRIESEIANTRQRGNDATRTGAEATAHMVEQLVMVARGAIAAANAFGAMSDASAKTAQDVANMAEGVAKIIANPGDVGAWIQTVGSAINLGANAIGMGKRDREEMANAKSNARAVEMLDTFSAALARAAEALQGFSGNTIVAVGRLVDTVVAEAARQEAEYNKRTGSRTDFGRENVDMTALRESLGVTMEELQGVAKAHGIELDGTVDSYRRLQEAMQKTRAQFAEFGTSLSEMRALQALQAKAFGTPETAAGNLDNLLSAGGVASPALNALLGPAIMANGPERLAMLRKELQELVTTMGPGGAGLDPKLLGSMTPAEFRAYVADLLDAIGALELEVAPHLRSAAEQLNIALSDLAMSWELRDIDDPGERFRQVTEKIGEMSPALRELAAGFDLSTIAGIKAFGDKVADLVDDVRAGRVVIEGFTTDQIVSALQSWESASDSAAAAISRAAGEVHRLFDGLDERELRAEGDNAGADILAAQKRGDADIASAKELLAKGLITQADYDRLVAVIGKEVASVIARNTAGSGPEPKTAERAGDNSVVGRAGAQSVDLLIGIGNTGLSLQAAQLATQREIRALLQRGFVPQAIVPPVLPGAARGPAGSGGSGGSGGIIVHQTLAFYAPVNGVDEVQAAVARGGSDIGAQIQRQVDTQRRVEGRAEVL